MQDHFDLAEPVSAEGNALILQEAAQAGNDQLAGHDQRDHPRVQPCFLQPRARGHAVRQQEDIRAADEYLVHQRIQVASQRAGQPLSPGQVAIQRVGHDRQGKDDQTAQPAAK